MLYGAVKTRFITSPAQHLYGWARILWIVEVKGGEINEKRFYVGGGYDRYKLKT